MPITKPESTEYAHYYHTYVGKVTGNDLIAALKTGGEQFEKFMRSVDAGKGDYKYAEGKWTIKEVILHLLDAERVFAYRALRFSRNDKTALAGFDENLWAPQSNGVNRTIEDLLNEGISIRKSTIALFEGMNEEMTKRIGNASGHDVSVRALGYIIAGHEIHHLQVIKERYL